jgi:hypothetical protein
MTNPTDKMREAASQVPLVDLLRGVPRAARLLIDSEDGMSTRHIPVGRLCHEAAAALSTLPASASAAQGAAQQAPAVPQGWSVERGIRGGRWITIRNIETQRCRDAFLGDEPLLYGFLSALLKAAPQAPAAPSVQSEGYKPLRRGWKIGGPSALPLDEWSEEDGAVLWWRFPIEEPPYVGNPLCDDWPGYHTHWTPLDLPAAPSEGET